MIERDEFGCKCHRQTFCPDWIMCGYDEEGTPIFHHKDDVKMMNELTHSKSVNDAVGLDDH